MLAKKSQGKLLIISNKYFKFCLIINLIVFLPFLANAQENKIRKKRIAILDFTSKSNIKETSILVKHTIESTLFKKKAYTIIEINPDQKTIKARKNIMSGCDDEDCAIEIGKKLSADYVVTGNISKIDNYIVNVKIINVKEQKVLLVDSFEIDSLKNTQKITKSFTQEFFDEVNDIEDGSNIKTIFSTGLSYLRPYGFFKKKASTGYAINVAIKFEDILFNNFILGAEGDYIYFNGKKNVTHHTIIVPILLNAGYRFKYFNLSFIPTTAFGFSYNNLYTYNSNSTTDYTKNTNTKPILRINPKFEFKVNDFFRTYVGFSHNTIFESAGNIYFLSYTIGATIRY